MRDDFTYSFSAEGASRPADRRRVTCSVTCMAINRRQCMGLIDARGGPLPGGTAPGVVPRRVQRRHLEPGGDLPDHAQLHHRCRNFAGRSRPQQKFAVWAQDDWQIVGSPDAEPRRALRRRDRHLCQRHQLPAVPGSRASRRLEQRAAAARVCVPAERSDGHPRRVGDLLRRCVRRRGVGDWQYADHARFGTRTTAGPISPRTRPTAGRCRPIDEANPLYCYNNNNAPGCLIRDVREFTALPEYIELPRTWQTSIGFQRQFGDTMAVEADYVYSQGRFEKDVLDNMNLIFDPATGANLRFQGQEQPPLPGLGRHLDEHAHRQVGLPRAGHRLHQAVQQSLAGVGHLYAVGPLDRRLEAVQRALHGPLPHRSRSGRGMGAVGGRSTAPGRIQRHLAGGARLPGERLPLPGHRQSGQSSNYGGDLRNTGVDLQRPPAPGRDDRAAAMRSSPRRRIGRACGCSSGSRCPAACRSMPSRKSSTSSTGRTGPSAPRRASRRSTCSTSTRSIARRSSGSG